MKDFFQSPALLAASVPAHEEVGLLAGLAGQAAVEGGLGTGDNTILNILNTSERLALPHIYMCRSGGQLWTCRRIGYQPCQAEGCCKVRLFILHILLNDLESQRACGGGRVQGGASEALLCSGDSHIRCGHPGPVSNPDAFKGLHLPVVNLKLCRVCTCPAWWRKFARKVAGFDICTWRSSINLQTTPLFWKRTP